MKIKKIISAITLSAVLAVSIGIHSSAQEVTVKIDDEKLECPTPARIENGSTMVPMRVIFEALGMEVEWNNDEKSVTAVKGDDTIKLTIGEKVLYLNGNAVELNVAPFIENDTTMVPVRAVSESVAATVEWKSEDYEVEITTAEYEANKDAWKDNTGVINVTDMTVTGEGVSVLGNTVLITEGGDFEVRGENDNVMIHVNTKYKVKLRLDGVTMTNPAGPAIFFENSNKSFITISKGTENHVTDGVEYTLDAKAAIFSNDDIEIKGEGTLYVASKAHHAIASDDDIKIEEGTMILNAEAKDGIHANNTIKILGGNISIVSYGDGIQAEEDVQIEGGEINVTTTGEVAQETGAWGNIGGFGGNMGGGRGNRNWQNQSGEAAQMQTTPSSDTTPAQDQMPQGDRWRGMEPMEGATMPQGMTPPEGMTRPQGGFGGGMMPPEGMENMTPPEGMENMMPPDGFGGMAQPENAITDETDSDEATATKGIKATTDITITGGKITVNAADHAIHSAATLTVKGGELNLSSEKGKGISAHGDVVIDNGIINITKASEGLESKANLTINGGTISIAGSDDGINAGGTGGRDVANRNNSEQETGHDLTINGGEIFVNAAGDGLDANGRMIINGGNIIVEGPTNSGNGALDSGGVIKVNGGTLIALGASGMAETPDNDSAQATFRLVTQSNIPSGSEITIKNAAGEAIYNYTTVKTGNSIVFSSSKLTVGETYTVTIGEDVHTIEMTSTVTGAGNGGWGNMGGFGGGRGR